MSPNTATIFCFPDSGLATVVRHAAVRCLSCETNFGNAVTDDSALRFATAENATNVVEGSTSTENVILFSDNHCNGLSINFRLSDSEARGLKRTFGLVVLSTGFTFATLPNFVVKSQNQ